MKINDRVNHPSHYTSGKVECIDALEAATSGLQGIEAVCTANAIKYLWRWKKKNGIEDLEKAIKYINFLIEKVDDQGIASEIEDWENQAKEFKMKATERMEQNGIGNITIKQACIEKAPGE